MKKWKTQTRRGDEGRDGIGEALSTPTRREEENQSARGGGRPVGAIYGRGEAVVETEWRGGSGPPGASRRGIRGGHGSLWRPAALRWRARGRWPWPPGKARAKLGGSRRAHTTRTSGRRQRGMNWSYPGWF